MATITSICNRALQEVGAGRIVSINDDTDKARQCKTIYESVKDAELEANYWNFAIKRGAIAADATAPAWGYELRYSLPSDFATLFHIERNLNGVAPDHDIESGFILTDEGSPLKIRYVRNDVTEGEFSALFAEAVAMAMAKSLVEGINQKGSLIDRVERRYNDAINKARKIDAIQKPPEDLEETPWLTERD